jgi:hypothetical protein
MADCYRRDTSCVFARARCSPRHSMVSAWSCEVPPFQWSAACGNRSTEVCRRAQLGGWRVGHLLDGAAGVRAGRDRGGFAGRARHRRRIRSRGAGRGLQPSTDHGAGALLARRPPNRVCREGTHGPRLAVRYRAENQHPVVQGWLGGAPIWSPDGRHLVVSWSRAGALDLWLVPTDGGREWTRLTKHADQSWLVPSSWSPDGRTLAVVEAKGTAWRSSTSRRSGSPPSSRRLRGSPSSLPTAAGSRMSPKSMAVNRCT